MDVRRLTGGGGVSLWMQDGVLRPVQVHGAGGELRRQGGLVQGAHRRGGQAVHIAQLHRWVGVAQVVAPDGTREKVAEELT